MVETIQRDLIPSYNHELFAKVLTLFDAEILGIDVIMEQGIEHDAREQKLIFLEVNSRPYLKIAQLRFASTCEWTGDAKPIRP